ncbi:DUF4189 domain-containing protein [Arthrobacter sp. ZGTC412]|uniref:DUF4189 domain-containing protein n=1 Tax=Arthrobacter sp. ZGTC412 TaxID=2058900 RepID=UPI0015E38A4E|nr:DUF4189 domain-containing protein [Arthrobacter sp. ZGTC412]
MKTRTGRHHPLAVAAFLLAALFSTTGLTAAASPAAEPAAVIQTEASVAAARYVSMAIYLPTFAWHATWASTASEAQTKALDQCNIKHSKGTYNCSSAGYAVNAYLAVAVSTHNGPWGTYRAATATDAGKGALAWCRYYGGKDACHVIFNRHSSEK